MTKPVSASPQPRCPNCGGNTLHMGRVNDQIRVECLNQECRILRFPKDLADFSQFFAPAPAQEKLSKREQEHADVMEEVRLNAINYE